MKLGRWVLMGATLLVPAQLLAGGPPCRADMEADRAALFTQADADGSETLSLEEFKTFESLMRNKMADRHFAHADTNGDGTVTLDEMQADRPGPGRGHGPPPF